MITASVSLKFTVLKTKKSLKFAVYLHEEKRTMTLEPNIYSFYT